MFSSRTTRLYESSPVFVQNLVCTAYGIKERQLRYGRRFRSFLDALDRSQWLPAEALHEIQNDRLRKLVTFCDAEVPYYKDLFKSLGISPAEIRTVDDLAALPQLDKETVRERPEAFLPRRPPEKLLPQTTGGTTGTPLRYMVTPSAMQYNYAAYESRFRRWAGVRFGDRMATINGRVVVPTTRPSKSLWRWNLAFNQLYFSAYHLSEDNLPRYVSQLSRFGPRVIVGYVSTVHAIAKHLLASDQAGLIRPRAILVSSETLFDWIRKDIEDAFCCKVHNGYGLGEMTALVTECDHGSMHVSPEYGVVETVEIGDQREIVSTGLFNYGTPLIRYRTGDLVDKGPTGKCGCGRELPRLGPIRGRVDDVIVTPEGVAVGPAALSLAFQSVPHLREAQVHQDSRSRIEVLAFPDWDFSEADEETLLLELRKRLGKRIDIDVKQVDEIARTSAGKQRLIVQSMPSTT